MRREKVKKRKRQSERKKSDQLLASCALFLATNIVVVAKQILIYEDTLTSMATCLSSINR